MNSLLKVEPKPQKAFQIKGEEVANSCWMNCFPSEDFTGLKMKISLSDAYLTPIQARNLAYWLLREANYVEQIVPLRRHNNRIKAKRAGK